MTQDTRPTETSDISERASTLGLVFGIAFALSTVLTYVLSLTEVIETPNWLRALMLAGIPLGFFGVPWSFAVARNGAGRRRGLVALLFAMG